MKGHTCSAIAKTALLGQAQPVWSFVPHGSKDRIDFGEQYPDDPEKARALLKEAPTEEAFRRAGHDFQRYVAENMLIASVASVPFL